MERLNLTRKEKLKSTLLRVRCSKCRQLAQWGSGRTLTV